MQKLVESLRYLAWAGSLYFAFCCSSGGMAQGYPRATIQGHVSYQDGSPVVGALVEFISFSGWEGVVPAPGVTDQHGFFRFSFPALGEGWVTASKVSEGYPDAAAAIYGRVGYESIKRIQLKAGETVNVNLRFCAPDAKANLKVTDVSNGQPISTAGAVVEWSDNSDIMFSRTTSLNGTLLFVLPKHRVKITVTAPGYAPWEYLDQRTGTTDLLASPGTEIHLQAALIPQGKH